MMIEFTTKLKKKKLMKGVKSSVKNKMSSTLKQINNNFNDSIINDNNFTIRNFY